MWIREKMYQMRQRRTQEWTPYGAANLNMLSARVCGSAPGRRYVTVRKLGSAEVWRYDSATVRQCGSCRFVFLLRPLGALLCQRRDQP